MTPTTEEIDSISKTERSALVGYCDEDERWFEFTRGVHFERCPICKKNFSYRHGFQITTQRSFSEKGKKKK